MPLPIGSVLGIFADNLTKRGSVIPLSKHNTSGWTKSLNIPRGGKTILYTGLLYQLIPAIDTMASQMAMFENSFITKFFGLGRIANKFINLSFFMALGTSKKMKAENNQVLINIAQMLKTAGVEYGYLYNEEMYSGALVYDEGMDESFGIHARRVAEIFRNNGVRRIITVDPHTTNILRDVYPKFVDNFDFEIVSYLNILEEKNSEVKQKQDDDLVIHDSCIYARYEGMVEPPRNLLTRAGVSVKEPELAGKSTYCCGGPMEALFPSRAHEISATRIAELGKEGENIVTMCPICQVNLRKAAGDEYKVDDISKTLAKSYIG
ncbi:MAG: (Fe-S)-binding protein [Spirochaetales bacterium]|nr:(Fe-S)-binding protein [Spirochaetales bacterium]